MTHTITLHAPAPTLHPHTLSGFRKGSGIIAVGCLPLDGAIAYSEHPASALFALGRGKEKSHI